MNFAVSGPPTVLVASLLFFAFVLAFHGIGVRVVGDALPRGTAPEIVLYHVFTIAVGAVALSVWTFAWGLARWLEPAVMPAFLALGVAAFFIDKLRHGADEAEALAGLFRRASLADRVGLSALAALLVLTFFGAQAPETGNDSMAYHLYFPKLHALEGRLAHDALHTRSLWPAMTGMLFTAGLLLQGTALAKLFAWMALPLALAGAAAFARLSFGAAAARWTLFFLAAVPALWQQSLYAYTDLTILLFMLLSFMALVRWGESGYAARAGAVAGVCLGALVSIKYSTIAPALFLAALAGARMRNAPSPDARAKARSAAIVLATAAAVGGFWYARSWALTGNPVFPFMARVFGNGFSQSMVGFAEIPRTPLNFVFFPWNLTMDVAAFGGEPLGVLFLAALPLLAFFPRRGSVALAAAVFLAFYAAAWYAAIQHVRFFLPALPFLALALGASAAEWEKRRSRLAPALVALFVAIAAMQAAIGAYYALKPLKAAFGVPPAKQYLRQNERTFEFMETVNEALIPGDRVLVIGEPRLFYAPREAILMNPVIERELERRNVGLREWLDEHRVYHLVTASDAGLEKPPVPVKLVASKAARDGGRTVHYGFWRRSG